MVLKCKAPAKVTKGGASFNGTREVFHWIEKLIADKFELLTIDET